MIVPTTVSRSHKAETGFVKEVLVVVTGKSLPPIPPLLPQIRNIHNYEGFFPTAIITRVCSIS